MGCGNVRLQFVPGPVLLFIGFVLQIVALSSANWCRAADDSVYMGLWQICFQVKVAEVQCFEFRERDYTPIIVFITSALCVLCAIFDFIAVLWGVAAVIQKKKRAIKWTKKAGVMGAMADVLVLIAVCLYAASYEDVQYQKIPRWTAGTDLRLDWSFYVTCVATVVILLGAVISITTALQSSPVSTVHVSPVTHGHSGLLVHPPPNTRIPSPFRLGPRAPSPLPFSRAAFQTPRMNHSPVLPS